MKKIYSMLLLLGIFVLVFASSFGNAFGVSSSYWRGNPVSVYPGEERVVDLVLQNMVGDEDIRVRAALVGGSEIASTETREYFVPAGTKDTAVPVTIRIPREVELGTTYVVTVSFETVTSGVGGGVAMGTGVDTSFDVVVVAEPPQNSPFSENYGLWIILAIVVIVLIAAVWIHLKRKKSSFPSSKNKY